MLIIRSQLWDVVAVRKVFGIRVITDHGQGTTVREPRVLNWDENQTRISPTGDALETNGIKFTAVTTRHLMALLIILLMKMMLPEVKPEVKFEKEDKWKSI